MSLIEQLGGYAKAKTKADELDYDLNNLEFLGGGSARESMHESLDSIEKALLQYRRQHKIFEVGDPVIRKWNNQLYWIISNIDNGSEFLIHKNKHARFKDCKVCELPCNLSHANDAEIEANRRLDLPESVVLSLREVS